MQPANQSATEKKTTQASAQAGSGKNGTVAFPSVAVQRKMNESPTEEALTANPETNNIATGPFKTLPPVQRVPDGTYKNGPPGGKGTKWDTNDYTQHNDETVPEKVIAIMKEPNDGGTPSVNPPGWDWLRQKVGRLKGKWVRFHIINAKLGGPGNDSGNLVPTTPAVNTNASWGTLETNAKNSASTDKDWTYVEVGLGYNDDFPAGIPETIDAEWGYYDDTDWEQVGSKVHLSQANPDDNEEHKYFLPSQVTQQMLKDDYSLSTKQAQVIKGLISQQWDGQDDFDEAMENALEEDDSLADTDWYSVHARIYVDDTDEGDSPYDVVFKK